ncbi:MAG: peptide chain release factor N(5)-glutamine methyltransferase [Candidatus Moraniibacteriota bacterium]|nr:MAG: peptide chain release factor N(5)-glutamine methyltransferase [Candidatus Moranbacteria bacterium]
MKTIRDLLNDSDAIILPREECELLIALVLKKDRVFVLAHPEATLTSRQEKRVKRYFTRRIAHEPLALIAKNKEFFGRNFWINKHTLVPRPETELLVEKTWEYILSTLKFLEPSHASQSAHASFDGHVLLIDVGTGSGNILITLAREMEEKNISQKNVELVGVDISLGALRVARKNARKILSNTSPRFFHSDLLSALPRTLFQRTKRLILTANLPYLSRLRYENAPKDVRQYEPKSALVSGADGFSHYRTLFETLFEIEQKNILPHSVTLFLEIDPQQRALLREAVSRYFPRASLLFFQDLAHRFRIARIEIEKLP